MMIIRPATPNDISQVADIARLAYAPYVTRMGREPAPMVQDFAEAQRLGRLWVHTVANQVAGYIVAFQNGTSFHLENVAVHPSFAGKGIGKALIQFIETQALEAGCTTVDLYTNIHMTENLTLYPRLGYKETDRRTENGFERVYFEKSLS